MIECSHDVIQQSLTHSLFVDENPCVDYSLLGPIATGCIIKHAEALIAETTTEGKCRYVHNVILLRRSLTTYNI